MKYIKVATTSIMLLVVLFLGFNMVKKITKEAKKEVAIADTANKRQKEAEKNRIESQRRTNPIMPAQA
ncbi:MAG TPA: hypothetical protein ENH85_07730 [Candidatus Scalindua sp.]|nr:hypothetical protein [Candidatus Scalindua sp.]